MTGLDHLSRPLVTEDLTDLAEPRCPGPSHSLRSYSVSNKSQRTADMATPK